MVCSNEAMCDPWVNPEQHTGVMEYYNKLPRFQSPDGPVQGSLVLSEKLLRSLPLPQIRQRHGVRGEDSTFTTYEAQALDRSRKHSGNQK